MLYLLYDCIEYFYLIYFIKLILLIIIIVNSFLINTQSKNVLNNKVNDSINCSFSLYEGNITNNNVINFNISNINYIYSKNYKLIEIKYYIDAYNSNNYL